MRKQRIAAWLALLLVGIGILYCLLEILVWHPGVLYVRRWTIDVAAGRRGYTLTVLGITLVNRTTETALSSLYRHVVGDEPPARWELMSARVRRLRYMVYQEGGYVGVLGPGEFLADALCQPGAFTREAQKAAVLRYLAILQSDSPGLAPDYSYEVRALAEVWDAAKGPIDAKDLPTFTPEPRNS